ncbi:MAG: Rnase Y domain-containing protein, partial [Cyclobacteriaceae bacterium]|nr:Rnase Y domain-containing protein [Cyclobacteriaceae bacterium]
MDSTILLLIALAVGLVVGVIINRIISSTVQKNKNKDLEEKADAILKEAELAGENIKKDKILEAKEKFLRLKSEFEDEMNRKKNLIITNENKIRQRE